MIKGHTDIDIWNTGFSLTQIIFPMISLFITKVSQVKFTSVI